MKFPIPHGVGIDMSPSETTITIHPGHDDSHIVRALRTLGIDSGTVAREPISLVIYDGRVGKLTYTTEHFLEPEDAEKFLAALGEADS